MFFCSPVKRPDASLLLGSIALLSNSIGGSFVWALHSAYAVPALGMLVMLYILLTGSHYVVSNEHYNYKVFIWLYTHNRVT